MHHFSLWIFICLSCSFAVPWHNNRFYATLRNDPSLRIISYSSLKVVADTTASYGTKLTLENSKSPQPSSLKQLLMEAQSSGLSLTQRQQFVLDLLSTRRVATVKDAMACIGVFKLTGNVAAAVRMIEYATGMTLPIDTKLVNNIMDVCAKAADYKAAETLFQRMPLMGIRRDVVTYGALLNCFAKSGQWQKTLSALESMISQDNLVPDIKCFTSVIGACAAAGRWHESLQSLQKMHGIGLNGDAVLYNNLIRSFANNNETVHAIEVFQTMRRRGIPADAYSYSALLTALATADCLEYIPAVIADMEAQCTAVGSTLTVASLATPYNVAITGLLRHGNLSAAMGLYDRMKASGTPVNSVTFTTLITATGKLPNYETTALQLFKEMVAGNITRNVAIYGATMAAAERLEDWKTAISLLNQMASDGIEGNNIVYNSAIAVCARKANFETAVTLLNDMKRRGVSRSVTTYNLLIGGCKATGRWKDAVQLLDDISADESAVLVPNTASFSITISVCVQSQEWGLALDLLQRMEDDDVVRNRVTYNSVIEAMEAAGETIRAELVYQSALRAGIYRHWISLPREDTLVVVSGMKDPYLKLNRTPAESTATTEDKDVVARIEAAQADCPENLKYQTITAGSASIAATASVVGKCPAHTMAGTAAAAAVTSESSGLTKAYVADEKGAAKRCPAHSNSETDVNLATTGTSTECANQLDPPNPSVVPLLAMDTKAAAAGKCPMHTTGSTPILMSTVSSQCPAHLNSPTFSELPTLTVRSDVFVSAAPANIVGKCPAHSDNKSNVDLATTSTEETNQLASLAVPSLIRDMDAKSAAGKCPIHATSSGHINAALLEVPTSAVENNGSVAPAGKCPAHSGNNNVESSLSVMAPVKATTAIIKEEDWYLAHGTSQGLDLKPVQSDTGTSTFGQSQLQADSIADPQRCPLHSEPATASQNTGQIKTRLSTSNHPVVTDPEIIVSLSRDTALKCPAHTASTLTPASGLSSGSPNPPQSTAPTAATVGTINQYALELKAIVNASTSSAVMDLHIFPLAVAKAAVMHALSEMCTGQVPMAKLEIITGRGNHRASGGTRGTLRRELNRYITALGLQAQAPNVDASMHYSRAPWQRSNIGRIVITKSAIVAWFEQQYEDDRRRKASGTSAHGNLFLRVANAKHTKSIPMNIRAVCPFNPKA